VTPIPTDKKMKSLLQASEAACQSTTQHILLSVSADGRVLASGTDKLVTGLVSEVQLYKKVKVCLGSRVAEAEESVGMLDCAGYGRSKGEKKLGEGAAPVGWPANIDWSKFKGSNRSGLKIDKVTIIIISILQAGGFSAETHVKPSNPDSNASDDDVVDDQIMEEYDVDVVQAKTPTKGEGEGTERKECSGGIKSKFLIL
jgi:hypothetical protein